MKNKGTVTFFAIALAVVSLFHISFTLRTYFIEKKAQNFAKGDKVVEQNYLDSISYKPAYNVLVKKYTYAECKEREINLGLDLQGGMHVMLEVELEDLLRELSGNSQEKDFQQALALAKKKQKNSQKDFISLFDESVKEINPNADLSAFFATLENKDEIALGASREKVLNFLRNKSKGALESTFQVLRKRIDKFGVTQPNIQLLEGTERILIELPGVDDPDRVRKLLQGAAKLEFWATYENKEVLPYFEEVNKVLSQKLSLTKDTSKKEGVVTPEKGNDFFKKPEAGKTEAKKDEKTAQKDGKIADTKKADTSKKADSKSDSADMANMSQEEFEKKYPLYRFLTLAVNRTDQGTYYIDGPIVGSSYFYDTQKVNAYLAMPEVRAVLPGELKFAWTAKAVDKDNSIYQLIALKVTTLDKKARLDGSSVTNARVDISPLGEREVSLSMNNTGAKTWEKMTEENIGRSIAIVLDGLVRSFPTVQTKISGGNSQITGGFTQEEAQDLSNILNSGKLQTRVNIIEEAIVGPSLGTESINKGIFSLVLGFVLVVVFMLFYYNKAGWIANLALFANLFFITGILASLGAALTLPGMAGVVLTIGMAVDANVLIYERIREELAVGKVIRVAIKEGFLKAYSAIIDSNLTTLFVGFVLYFFGSGPIHGFATILIIGILSSLFTAILISRVIFESQLKRERHLSFSNKFTEHIFSNLNFDFLGIRKIAYLFSGIVIVAGIISMLTQGFKYGVDFSGGYSYVVRFENDVDAYNITNKLTQPLNGKPEVKVFGARNQVKITTSYLINDDTEGSDEKVQGIVVNTLKSMYPDNKFEILSTQKVGPTIADDIKVSALWSIIISLLIIFIYIFLRFRTWQYALAAVITPFHDVMFILGIFSLFKDILPFSLELDQAFIAALLTIIGYSINDTVVVFDRIREKLGLLKQRPYFETVNSAINETLSRTLLTAGTTLIVVLILFIFGGEIIRGFSFALLIGIVIGTYSSIFVSTPVLIELSKKEQRLLREHQEAKKINK